MRIGIDARFYGPKCKGLGRYTQKLIENLELIDHKNEYIIFLRKEMWNEYMPQNHKFKKVLADFRWYSLPEQIFFPILIRRQKLDLMHFLHFNVPILYFGKFIVTIHDLILRHFPTHHASTLGPIRYFFKNLSYRIVIWLAIKRAEEIIAVSIYVKNDITKNFSVNSDKISVIYEGVDIKAENKEKLRMKNFELKQGIQKDYLLYVGNAYPHKNLERLIRAFGILINKYKQNLQLILVGEKDYFYKRLKSFVDYQPLFVRQNIIFTGFVSDEYLSVLYQGASIYIFPSLCEGFGLPPLEAMNFGVPVVSSDATCLPEILGNAAFYFEARNAENISKAIIEVLSNKHLQENLIQNGYKQIKKYYWKKMAKKIIRIYEKNI